MGFVANLRVHGVDVKGARMVVLGAGGAATAVTMQSALDGAAEIHIFNRKGYTFYPNAELTVKKLAERVPGCKATVTDLFDTEALAEAVNNCDILVNATKVGMAPLDKETLIDKSLFRHDLVVLRHGLQPPKETRMIVEAKEAGVKAAIGGIGMLLRQGVEGFPPLHRPGDARRRGHGQVLCLSRQRKGSSRCWDGIFAAMLHELPLKYHKVFLRKSRFA